MSLFLNGLAVTLSLLPNVLWKRKVISRLSHTSCSLIYWWGGGDNKKKQRQKR